MLLLMLLPLLSVADLEAALTDRDPAALEAAGKRASASGLEPHIGDPGGSRRAQLAACRAAPAAVDGWALLGPLAQAAKSLDRSIATACAAAAERIATELDHQEMLVQGIPPEMMRAALATWRAVGADESRWADVRVRAMTVARDLVRALGPAATDDDVAFDRDDRLADADPEVRRAALELLPLRDPPLDAIAARLENEPSDEVALSAAQALCAPLAFGDDAAPILSAAGADGLARIRTLVAGKGAAPAALLDAARCLAADPSADSNAALKKLAANAPRSIRRELRALVRRK